MNQQLDRVRIALSYLNPVSREVWIRAATCIKSEFPDNEGFEIWDQWGSQCDSYKASTARAVWKSFKSAGKLTIASLFYDAKSAGWVDTGIHKKRSKSEIDADRAKAAERATQAAAEEAALHAERAIRAQQIWDAATPCDTHPYLERKGVASHGLRVGRWERTDPDTGEVIVVINQSLLIPMRDRARKLWTLQGIDPEEGGKKRYFAGGAKKGNFFVIGKSQQHEGRNVFVLGEGYATCASVHAATGHMVLVCFDTSNLLPVAKALRDAQPEAIILFAADNDTQTDGNPGVTKAKAAAAAVGGLVAVPPPGDFNDLQQAEGLEAVGATVLNVLTGSSGCDDQTAPHNLAKLTLTEEEQILKIAVLGYARPHFFIWRKDTRSVEIYKASELGTVAVLQTIAPLERWEECFHGNFKVPMGSNFLITVAKVRGAPDLRKMPSLGMPDQEVRKQLLVAIISRTPNSAQPLIAELLALDEQTAESIRFDDFSTRLMCVTPVSWGGRPGPWTDDHDAKLTAYLYQIYSLTLNVSKVGEAAEQYGRTRRFHPVREYLDRHTWDGVPRLDGWLIDCLGVADSPYSRAVARIVLVAAAARVFHPGCKFDNVLSLEGPQGAGKSRAVRALVPMVDWFSEDLGAPIGDKDAMVGLKGKLIIELAEGAGMKKSGNEVTKSFLSRCVDTYRSPYGRRTEDHPRQCVFVLTVNPAADGTWLDDPTGSRRIWPIKVDYCDVDRIESIRDQLWAEAVHLYRLGSPLHLPQDVELLARAEQEERQVGNPWDEIVGRYLGSNTAPMEVSCLDIYMRINKFTPRRPKDLAPIAQALRKRGWIEGRSSGKPRLRIWLPPASRI